MEKYFSTQNIQMLNVPVEWSKRRVQGGHIRAAGISMALKIATDRVVNQLTEFKKEKYILWVKDQTKSNKFDDQYSQQTDHTGHLNSKYYIEGKFKLDYMSKEMLSKVLDILVSNPVWYWLSNGCYMKYIIFNVFQ